MATPTFETKHFINGTDVTSMSEDQMIQAIANGEAEIAKLEALSTKSKTIANKIAAIKATIADIVTHLDAGK